MPPEESLLFTLASDFSLTYGIGVYKERSHFSRSMDVLKGVVGDAEERDPIAARRIG